MLAHYVARLKEELLVDKGRFKVVQSLRKRPTTFKVGAVSAIHCLRWKEKEEILFGEIDIGQLWNS